MRKQNESETLSSAVLPPTETLQVKATSVEPVDVVLRQRQAGWAEFEQECLSSEKHQDAEFAYKMARLCEILAEMVNPEITLNSRQLFWVDEMLTALPGQVSRQEALSGNYAALALVGIAQYINSC